MAIQIRRGTDSDWESGKSNIIVGEPAITTDTKRCFVGTGTGTYAEFANQTQVSSLDADINTSTTGLKDRMTAVETDIAGLGDASELDYDVLGTGSSIVMADYVVEQGTTTGWLYRKWDSGIVEMWRERISAIIASDSFVSDTVTLTFPVTIMGDKRPYFSVALWQNTSSNQNFGICDITGWTTTGFSFHAFRTQSYSHACEPEFTFYITAYWK